VSIRNSLCDRWGEQAVIQITFLTHIIFVNIQEGEEKAERESTENTSHCMQHVPNACPAQD
jgi:hypothetical protein